MPVDPSVAAEESTGDNDVMTQDTEASALSDFASVLGDQTRASMCLALLDGRAWTAGELAKHAGVAASTATEHLNKLIAAGIVTERRQGRHRYVMLAGPQMAELIESLSARLSPNAPAVSGLRASTAGEALARGRTCYDHFAGRLGIAIADAMIDRFLIDISGGFSLTTKGYDWFEGQLRVDTAAWRQSRRDLIRECLDWTERRSHVAGVAGAEICRSFLKHGWVRRIGSGRAVRLTPSGRQAVSDLLEIDPDAHGLS